MDSPAENTYALIKKKKKRSNGDKQMNYLMGPNELK